MKANIGGVLDFSSIDYPKKIASVIFFSGCNFRCPFCHNPELIEGKGVMETDSIIAELSKYREFVDAVVITGGEPTLQPEAVKDFCKKLKPLGFKIKLDTNGSNPQFIQELLNDNLIDFIAMDVKAPFTKEGYEHVSKAGKFVDNVKRSYRIILDSGIAHEFRMPVVPKLNEQMLDDVAKEVKDSEKFVLEQFSGGRCYDKAYNAVDSPSEEQMIGFAKKFSNKEVRIRTKQGEKTISK